MERRRTATATGLYDSFCHIYFFLHSFSLHLFVSQKSLNEEELYRQKYRKLLHCEINILNILNVFTFTEIIGMAPPINVQDWYGDRHTCQIASGALGNCGPTCWIFVWVYVSVTIRYDSGYLTCSKKLTGSQLSLPHGINRKLKCETKNKMMSVISPVRSRYREAVQ